MKTNTIILYLLVWALPAQAATVFLRDGGRVVGTVVSSSAEEVQVSTSRGVERIPTSEISRIDYETAAPQLQAPPAPPAGPPAAAPASAPPPPSSVPPSPPPPPYEYQVEPPPVLGRGSQEVSFDLGIDVPLNDVDLSAIPEAGSARNGEVGPLVGLQYLYQLDSRLGVGASFEFMHRSAGDSFDAVAHGDTNIFGDNLLFMGVARVLLRKKGIARPYVLAGLGAHRTSLTIDSAPQPGFAWRDTGTTETRRLVDDHAWGFAAMARLGIEFFTSSPTTLGIEAGWARVDKRTYSATPAGQAPVFGLSGVDGAINFFTIAGRFGFGW